MQCCAAAARGIAMTQTYRAVMCGELRPRDVLRIKHLPQSPFAPGSVRVAVTAPGVDFPD